MTNGNYQVVVTGYGPFMQIKENPSGSIAQLVAKQFPKFFKSDNTYQLLHKAIITVEIDQVDKEIKKIKSKIKKNKEQNPDDKYLIIHLGVAASLPDDVLKLETRCFNAKCFENQNDYKHGLRNAISDKYSLGSTFSTAVRLSEITEVAPRKKGHPKLEVSHDPGEYLCNYIL